MRITGKVSFHLRGVIVEKINGFTDLGNRVGKGLTGFPHQDPEQRLQLLLHQLCGADKDVRPFLCRCGEPDLRCTGGGGKGMIHFIFSGRTNVTDNIMMIRRVSDRLRLCRCGRCKCSAGQWFTEQIVPGVAEQGTRQ